MVLMQWASVETSVRPPLNRNGVEHLHKIEQIETIEKIEKKKRKSEHCITFGHFGEMKSVWISVDVTEPNIEHFIYNKRKMAKQTK